MCVLQGVSYATFSIQMNNFLLIGFCVTLVEPSCPNSSIPSSFTFKLISNKKIPPADVLQVDGEGFEPPTFRMQSEHSNP